MHSGLGDTAEPAATVMVVIPHPDDAEISCGGTVAKWTAEGRRVIYVLCTSGDKGSDDPEMTPERLATIREREQQEAARILGVEQVIFLRHPDGGLKDTPDFRGELVRLIREHRPGVVMTADPHRKYLWHRDHRITSTVTLDAIFPYARDRLYYPELMAEGLLPHKVKEVYLWGSEEPNVFIDIGATFDLKMAALSCHVSQVGPYLGKGFEGYIRERAAKAGESQGLSLAEAFHRIEITY